MPKLKKPQKEEGESTEIYESFDEDMDTALSEDALDGIVGSDDDFNPEAVLGLDLGVGSDGI
ncbi:MAG: hypothetical protein UT05_C0003G0068 [Parcubacteria group bacterium GW2011_GWF2_38_76]|nr:MAG: hypothetical protein UT05_C0003G0068 [Parcubacteria group bacterium GW2011_GWF2_38_76]HBM46160.1 hypothetical protein [Patescibacteria group bacterium]